MNFIRQGQVYEEYQCDFLVCTFRNLGSQYSDLDYRKSSMYAEYLQNTSCAMANNVLFGLREFCLVGVSINI